ncbi:hypothetical protein HYX12_02300, partial [Candidatus Woesearchaeota archaeon]|nr:hypothetical protein [Candidatus Woesearchaeota archaeon]
LRLCLNGLTIIQIQQQQAQQAPVEVPKSAKPEVELYVFTYCPYGLQMEKAAAPVVKLLGNKMDFKIRQIGAMHGPYEEKEAKRQLCINKLYPKKFWDYLTYFAIDSDIGNCRGDDTCVNPLINKLYNKLSIDGSKVDACMNKDGASLYAAEESNSQQNSVGGSPTMIINGVQSSVARNPEAIKQAICSAFSTEPSECQQTLSSDSASPGFAAAAASCGI